MDENLPALNNRTDSSFTIYFKHKERGVWMYGKTFDNLSECIKEQRDLERLRVAEKSVIIKTEVTTKQTYLLGC